MQNSTAISALDALVASLIGMVGVVETATQPNGVVTALGGAELVQTRIDEMTQSARNAYCTGTR